MSSKSDILFEKLYFDFLYYIMKTDVKSKDAPTLLTELRDKLKHIWDEAQKDAMEEFVKKMN